MFQLAVLVICIHINNACPYLKKNARFNRSHPLQQHIIAPKNESVKSFAPYCIQTNGLPAQPSIESIYLNYIYIKENVINKTLFNSTYQLKIFATALNLAWHDSAEFDQKTNDLLGADGCLSNSVDNKELYESSIVSTIFEPIWQNICHEMSRADYWALLGKISFEYSQFSALRNTKVHETSFSFGRIDQQECNSGSGRMPNADGFTDELDRVFVSQMGLLMSDAVTLLGAHTIGNLQNDTSSFDSTPNVFDNQYYQLLINEIWDYIILDGGSYKNKWKTRFATEKQYFRLNSEINLCYPLNNLLMNASDVIANQSCFLVEILSGNATPCCTILTNGVSYKSVAMISTYTQILRYTELSSGNDAFLADFAYSFAKMMAVGYGKTGKLGQLLFIDLNASVGNNFPPVIVSTALVATGFFVVFLILGFYVIALVGWTVFHFVKMEG